MRCLSITPDFTLVVTSAVECAPSDYVLLTLSELEQHTLNPFRLSAAEGGLIGAAILGVWAAAFAFRAAIRALKSGEPET